MRGTNAIRNHTGNRGGLFLLIFTPSGFFLFYPCRGFFFYPPPARRFLIFTPSGVFFIFTPAGGFFFLPPCQGFFNFYLFRVFFYFYSCRTISGTQPHNFWHPNTPDRPSLQYYLYCKHFQLQHHTLAYTSCTIKNKQSFFLYLTYMS